MYREEVSYLGVMGGYGEGTHDGCFGRLGASAAAERRPASYSKRTTLARLQIHWLLLVNLLLGTLICPQIPSHSYFLFGYQMAPCSRNLAIYSALFVGSIAFR